MFSCLMLVFFSAMVQFVKKKQKMKACLQKLVPKLLFPELFAPESGDWKREPSELYIQL